MRSGRCCFELAPEHLQWRHFATRAVAADKLAEQTERNLDPRLLLRRCCDRFLGHVSDSARSSLDDARKLFDPVLNLFARRLLKERANRFRQGENFVPLRDMGFEHSGIHSTSVVPPTRPQACSIGHSSFRNNLRADSLLLVA